MRSIGPVVLGASMIALLAGPIDAQEIRRRSGLWYGMGLGGAVARVGCDICVGSREGGFAGSLRIGGTVSRHVLLGVEAVGWARSRDDIDRRLGTLSEIAYWYPSSRGVPYYLRGGIGVVAYRAHDDVGDEEGNAVTSTALQAQIGVGYDFPVSRNVSVSPSVNLIGSIYGGLKFNGASVASSRLTFLQFGLGVTRH